MGDRFTVTKSEVDPLQRGSVDSSGSAYGATPTAAPQPAAVDAQPNSPVSTDLSAPDRGNANNNNDRRTSRDSTKKLSSGVLAYGGSYHGDHGGDAAPFAANIEATDESQDHLYLYKDDFGHRPKVASFLQSVRNYEPVQPRASDVEHGAELGGDDEVAVPAKSAQMGTLIGVYLPCIQNIFGVLLFIRLAWIVGTAGWMIAFIIVFVCGLTTILTAVSMSAIATNGKVPGGGSYFMISRTLGPEFGGAVGILFYLGTTAASAMYIVGAVEIMLNYISADLMFFGDHITGFENYYRCYGTALVIILGTVVFIGVRFVNKFAVVALVCVLLSISAIYVGLFWNYEGDDELHMCVYKGRLLRMSEVLGDDSKDVSRIQDACIGSQPRLQSLLCGGLREGGDLCRRDLLNTSILRPERALPGLFAEGTASANMLPMYREKDQFITSDPEDRAFVSSKKDSADAERGRVLADITSTFTVLLAIYFPSVTGIMAGSNRSGDLKDAQKSIPRGTIAAILTTSTVYISMVIFFGVAVHPLMLRDKFGESVGGSLVAGRLAIFSPWIIYIGSFLSTLGAGLQSLTGAPRLLQAIAKDEIIPILSWFSVISKRGEPKRALFLTLFISECVVLIGNIDYITPVVTMFFLMCYGFVNCACALQSLLRNPNWRPRFRYYHWALSLLGLVMCLAIMFISSWLYAIVALALAAGIYRYIEWKGAEKEWGDGIRGLALASARYSLLRLEESGPIHTKNWRPQILVFVRLDEELNVCDAQLLEFAAQMKAGKGLTVAATIIEGDYRKRVAEGEAAEHVLRTLMKSKHIKGFVDVLVTKNLLEGMKALIQTNGLGMLRHNTVMLGWPGRWRQDEGFRKWKHLIEVLRVAHTKRCAIMIPKGVQEFPSNLTRLSGTIDVWWIVHDGGLLMLLPFLLKQTKVWKNCHMRIFTAAQMEDNTIKLKRDLETFIYHLRMHATAEVVEMTHGDISAYTYERTLVMEQRNALLKNMRLTKKDRQKEVQTIVDSNHPPAAPHQAKRVQIRAEVELIERHPSIAEDDDELSTSSESDRQEEQPSRAYKAPVADSVDATATPTTSTQLDLAASGIERRASVDSATELADGMAAQQKSSRRDSVKHQRRASLKHKVDEANVRRMHTAVRLNEVMVQRSHRAQLVILNLPPPPRDTRGEENYMEFVEVLTEGLERVLLVRGGGQEVVTIYS